jgi:Dolichyl-phosphate-mannose-protein mannosyltransferase
MNRFPLLVALLLLKAAIMTAVILFAGIDLGPEEAQYWTWSRHLDWGYYSKPPGIAWEIWGGTKLFGNTELGVRSGAVLFAFLIAIGIYFFAKACRLREDTAFWAAVIMALSPLGVMGSLMTVTDGGLILFWTLSCFLLVQESHYILLGLAVALGALFKWPMYLFWIFAFLFYAKRKLLLSFAISLLAIIPSLIWNWQHNFVTFRHVHATILGYHQKELGATYLKQGNLLDFFGAQGGLLSPIFFIFLLIAYLYLFRKSLTRPLAFCATVTGSLLLIYTTISYFQKMQGNWCVFAYPTGVVFLAWFMLEGISWGKVWLYLGLIAAFLQNLILYTVPKIQAEDLFYVPYKLNIFRHYMGWNRLGELLTQIGYDPQQNFLFSDRYQMSSIMSFYSRGQKRAYFLNLLGLRQNQFCFWPGMAEEQKGKTGFFVITENAPACKKWNEPFIQGLEKQLLNYFSKVEFIGIKPLFEANGVVVKEALIFKCIDYNGKEPANANRY